MKQISGCLGQDGVDGRLWALQEKFLSDGYVNYPDDDFLMYMCVKTYQIIHFKISVYSCYLYLNKADLNYSEKYIYYHLVGYMREQK